MQLKNGTVLALFHNQRSNPLLTKPILQVTSVDKVYKKPNEMDRIKANLSDGHFFIKAVFSTKFNNHFTSETIKVNSLIRISAYEVRQRESNVFLYVTDLEDFQKTEKMEGNPRNVNDPKERSNADANKNNVENKVTENYSKKPVPENNIKSNNNINKVSNTVTNNNESESRVKRQSLSTTSIMALNPFSNKWVVKGRCISKSEIRKFTNQKGEGKFFFIYLVDESGSIKVSCFNETVDLFYEMFDVGKVYNVSNGTVKMTNRKFSTATSEYEINLERNSEITLVYDDKTPKFFFKFVKVQDIAPDTMIDFIGAVKTVGEVQSIVLKKDGSTTTKRDIVLVDETGHIRLTIWGSKTETEIEVGDILALNGVSVREYNGPNLSTAASTEIHRNPDLEQSFYLKGWFMETGKNIKIVPKVQDEGRSFISELTESKYATLCCQVTYIKEDTLFYNACEECNRKVTSEGTSFRCERCDKEFVDCNARYMLRLQIGDCSGQTYASCFDKEGECLIKQSAKSLRDTEDSSQVQDWVKSVLFKDVILSVKKVSEIYNNEEKEKIVIRAVHEMDYVKESNRLINEIRNSLN